MAAIVLISVVVMPSAALAHPGHGGAHLAAGHATQTTPGGVAVEVSSATEDANTGGGMPYGSCGGPCCNVACSPACASHALSNAGWSLAPGAVVLARLGAPHEALPTDPPRRRLPKPPRA